MEKKQTFKKIILADLKARKLDAIAAKITSIRYRSFAGGDAVDVSATNLYGSERAKLQEIVREYMGGSFDGMQDLYTHHNTKTARSAKYTSLHCEYTPEWKEWARAMVVNDYGVTNDQEAQKQHGQWFDVLVHRILVAREAEKLAA